MMWSLCIQDDMYRLGRAEIFDDRRAWGIVEGRTRSTCQCKVRAFTSVSALQYDSRCLVEL